MYIRITCYTNYTCIASMSIHREAEADPAGRPHRAPEPKPGMLLYLASGRVAFASIFGLRACSLLS